MWRQRTLEQNTVIKTNIKNISLENVKPKRAGVILYTVHNDNIFIGLGLDAKTHDLTDFGGTVHYPTDKDVITGALREFDEETLSIFNVPTETEIDSCPVLYDNANLIIFLHININPDQISKTFNEKYYQTINYTNSVPEVCGITWITWEEFQHNITTKSILFSRVRKFLCRAGDFSYLL